MALEGWVLTTLATVKAELGISNSNNDDLLERYINAASQAFLTIIDRELHEVVRTGERSQGAHDLRLYTKQYPILSIQQILDCDGSELDSDDYDLINPSKEGSYINRDCGWKKSQRIFGDLTDTIYGQAKLIYTIDYTSGYCTPQQVELEECSPRTLPYDIEELIIEAVSQKFKMHCTGTQGMKDYKVGNRTITWKDLLESVNKAIISRYMRPEQ